MIYVMSDIHGNSKRFESIMQQINLQPEDTLYILGDIVDRNPNGIEILRQIMQMGNVKMLLGNHEYMMLRACDPKKELDDWEKRQAINLWYRNGGFVTHSALEDISKNNRQEIFDFLHNIPLNIKIEVNNRKYLLVHASPMENYSWVHREYKTKEEFALWHRWNECDAVPDGYTLIFGHTPTSYFQENIPLEIWQSNNAIGIDCGCAYSAGRLACIRLDDMQVYYSE